MATARFAHLVQQGYPRAQAPSHAGNVGARLRRFDAPGRDEPATDKKRKNPDIQGAERLGRRSERDRWASVFAKPIAAKNIALAVTLLADTNKPAGDIIASLQRSAGHQQRPMSIAESWAAAFAKVTGEDSKSTPVQASWSNAFKRVGVSGKEER